MKNIRIKYFIYLSPILIVVFIVLFFGYFLPRISVEKQLEDFRGLELRSIESITIEKMYNVKKSITYTDFNNIKGIMSILRYDNILMVKEKRSYPIVLRCEIFTKENKYIFELFKDRNDSFVNVFFVGKRSSIYLNGYDKNNLLDKIYNEL